MKSVERRQSTPSTRISGVVPSSFAQIKAGTFVGIANVPGTGGASSALEVVVFPDAMKGAGLGDYPWDLALRVPASAGLGDDERHGEVKHCRRHRYDSRDQRHRQEHPPMQAVWFSPSTTARARRLSRCLPARQSLAWCRPTAASFCRARMCSWQPKRMRQRARRSLPSASTAPYRRCEHKAHCPRYRALVLPGCCWPGPDVGERQLFGVSMRTTGFRRSNRKLKNPQSTLCCRPPALTEPLHWCEQPPLRLKPRPRQSSFHRKRANLGWHHLGVQVRRLAR